MRLRSHFVKIEKAKHAIRLGLFEDETSAACLAPARRTSSKPGGRLWDRTQAFSSL
jgi:hypothetical protein